MAVLSVLLGVAAAASIAAGVATTATALSKSSSSAPAPAPTYNEETAKKQALEESSAANKKRILSQTETTRTSALGALGSTTSTGKKTLLGA